MPNENLFSGSSLEEHGDSLGMSSSVDAEVAAARAQVSGDSGQIPAERALVPLPPKRLMGATGKDGQYYAWSEVDGQLAEPPHVATLTERAHLQRGRVAFQSPQMRVGETPAAQTWWDGVPRWLKVAGVVVGGVGGVLLVEHYAIPKALSMVGLGGDEEYEVAEEQEGDEEA